MAKTTSNPVLSRNDIFTREVGFHDAPSSALSTEVPLTQTAPTGVGAPPLVGVPTMTINDVVVKTALLFVVGAVGVAIAWATGFQYGITIVAALVGFGLAMANIFMRRVSPPLVMAYALAEGVFLGGISSWYQ